MQRRRGFTLIELAVVVAIVGVLAAVAVPVTELAVQRSREHQLRQSLRQIRTAIDDYKRAYDQGRILRRSGATGYPPSLDVLVGGVEDARNPNKARIYFLRRLPRDPMETDMTLAASATWGLRAYASPPDDPQSGDDVFDVYSRSERTGLNGLPYRNW